MDKESPILLLGNPRLYEVSSTVKQEETKTLGPVIDALHEALMGFRAQYNRGRAIAAPQIGVMKRILYMHIEKPQVFINPEFTYRSPESVELWDDCMSFPDLLVKVRRHVACRMKFKDLDWNDHEWELQGDLSELLQHEYDHLDGILATMKAVDHKSLVLSSQKRFVDFAR